MTSLHITVVPKNKTKLWTQFIMAKLHMLYNKERMRIIIQVLSLHGFNNKVNGTLWRVSLWIVKHGDVSRHKTYHLPSYILVGLYLYCCILQISNKMLHSSLMSLYIKLLATRSPIFLAVTSSKYNSEIFILEYEHMKKMFVWQNIYVPLSDMQSAKDMLFISPSCSLSLSLTHSHTNIHTLSHACACTHTHTHTHKNDPYRNCCTHFLE